MIWIESSRDQISYHYDVYFSTLSHYLVSLLFTATALENHILRNG